MWVWRSLRLGARQRVLGAFDMGSKHSKDNDAHRLENACASYALDEQPTPDQMKELKSAAEKARKSATKDYNENVSVALTTKESCVVVHEGKKLALLEAYLKRSDWSETEFSVAIILDTSEAKSSRRRIGTLAFRDDELPCPLKDLFATQWLPQPVYREGKIYASDPGVSSAPFDKMLKMPELHRMSTEDWERDYEDRSRVVWYRSAREQVFPPGEKRARPATKAATSAAVFDSLRNTCPTLEALLDEQKNSNSHLAKLPVEIVYQIYGNVFKQIMMSSHIVTKGIFASVVAKVKFPPPVGIVVNMMPFRIGDASSIPENMRQYVPLLAACPVNRAEDGQIGYLTIHESTIEEEGASQRRGGIHTETPGVIWLEANRDPSLPDDVKGRWEVQQNSPLTVAWGRGIYESNLRATCEYIGGLYMASNVADSCCIWNCKIRDPGKVVGPHGDLEHLRHVLGEGETLDAGEIVWMTDSTPHESLPLPAGTKRQYFRLVTSAVSVWYEDHSTKNPLGITPPSDVVILKGNKFEMEAEQRKKIKWRESKGQNV